MKKTRNEEAYYQPEEIEGFYVEGMMKRVWAVLLDTLSEIDIICKRHGLTWFTDSGTLLGAVRHNGYVPWDDDIDIALLRPDYEKLLLFMEEELPEGYYLHRPAVESHGNVIRYEFWYSKVTNGYGYNCDKESLERFHGCPYPVGLDIFPLDGVPDDLEERENFIMIFQFLQITYMELAEGIIDEKKILQIEQICNFQFDRSESLFWQLNSLGNRFSQLYPVGECRCISQLWYRYLLQRGNDNFEKEWYSSTCMLPFEDMEVSCPIDYKNVLRIRYGENYMIPVQGTQAHTYPAYGVMYKRMSEMEQSDITERELFFAKCLHVEPRELKEISVISSTEAASYHKYYFDGQFFICRMPIKPLPDYFDPVREASLYQRLSNSELLLKPTVFLEEEGGYKITPYIENEYLGEFKDNEHLLMLLDVLKMFHGEACNSELPGITPLERIEFWKSDISQNEQDGLKEYGKKVEVLEKKLKDYPMHIGLAHMDLTKNKILFSTKEGQTDIRILGIKYSGRGDIDWDFGTLSAEGFYEPDQILQLVVYYYEDNLDEDEIIQTYEKILIYAAIASYDRVVRFRLSTLPEKDWRRHKYKSLKYLEKIFEFLENMN